jgi:hypothetical protein
MDIRKVVKTIASMAVFAVVIVGVFWLTQKKLTSNVTQSALIAVLSAVILSYIYNKLISNFLIQTEYAKSAKLEARGLRAHHKRLEEKVARLTTELETANQRLKMEVQARPLDQRQLQQRLKHLNCLYALSKIVNRQEIPLEQIFQETIHLIREAYRYPDSISVRLNFDGVRYNTDKFERSELSRHTHIKAHEENVGTIEVYRLGGKIESGEEPFLKEEDDLLSAVAEWLGSIAERKKAE